jgi:hypothetical protein
VSAPETRDLGVVLEICLAVALGMLIVGEVRVDVAGIDLRLHYKTALRALAVLWVASLVVPALRSVAPYRRHPGDPTLALFVVVAGLSVALGGGHWGDVRNLAAAIGIGGLALVWMLRTLDGLMHRP